MHSATGLSELGQVENYWPDFRHQFVCVQSERARALACQEINGPTHRRPIWFSPARDLPGHPGGSRRVAGQNNNNNSVPIRFMGLFKIKYCTRYARRCVSGFDRACCVRRPVYRTDLGAVERFFDKLSVCLNLVDWVVSKNEKCHAFPRAHTLSVPFAGADLIAQFNPPLSLCTASDLSGGGFLGAFVVCCYCCFRHRSCTISSFTIHKICQNHRRTHASKMGCWVPCAGMMGPSGAAVQLCHLWW